MFYPKLKVRPRSTHTVTEFGGLLHNEEAPMGRWYNAYNLSNDEAPALTVRKRRVPMNYLDGNTLKNRIASLCEGDHPVILDAMGYLHCNGYKLYVGGPDGDTYIWKTSCDTTPQFFVAVRHWDNSALEDSRADGYPYLFLDGEDAGPGSAKIVYDAQGDKWWTNITGSMEEASFTRTLEGGNTIDYFDDIGVEIEYTGSDPDDGYTITMEYSAESIFASGYTSMIQLGAKVYILVDNGTGWGITMWVNVVDLAAGTTMIVGTNYDATFAAVTVTTSVPLTLCDIDGNAYTGVVTSSSEPAHTGYWMDTSGSKSVLKEWNTTEATWTVITSTFVKVNIGDTEGYPGYSDRFRAGDTVKLSVTYAASATPQEIIDMLNEWHYLYGVTSDSLIVSGIMPSDSYTVTFESDGYLHVARDIPVMDFIVESGNRLWGCRYDPANSINEIYASKLGDPLNWHVFQGLSTDSWTASRGTAAPFTGAAVLSGHPLFFREESLEKVYPSASGAHQIQEYNLDGVEAGSHDSLVVIDERLYYKSRLGFCVYEGTMPRNISSAFGKHVPYKMGTAARHLKKYCCAMIPEEHLDDYTYDDIEVGVYDTKTGQWQIETCGWLQKAVTWQDRLYYVLGKEADECEIDGVDYTYDKPVYAFEGTDSESVTWSAQTGVIGYELPEHRYISCVRIRFRMIENGGTFKVFIRYDDGAWIQKASYTSSAGSDTKLLNTKEINIYPRRCDHFRLYLSGENGIKIISLSYRMERSEGGH